MTNSVLEVPQADGLLTSLLALAGKESDLRPALEAAKKATGALAEAKAQADARLLEVAAQARKVQDLLQEVQNAQAEGKRQQEKALAELARLRQKLDSDSAVLKSGQEKLGRDLKALASGQETLRRGNGQLALDRRSLDEGIKTLGEEKAKLELDRGDFEHIKSSKELLWQENAEVLENAKALLERKVA